MKGAALRIVDAAYRIQQPEPQWLDCLARALAAAFPDAPAVTAFALDASTPHTAATVAHEATIAHDEAAARAVFRLIRPVPPEALRRLHGHLCSTTSENFGEELYQEVFLPTVGDTSVRDSLGLGGLEPDGRGIVAAVALRQKTKLPSRTMGLWRRVAVHLHSGFRLRNSIKQPSAVLDSQADAIFEGNGRLAHVRSSSARHARQELRQAVLHRERALGALAQAGADSALWLWKGLVEGNWSLVDWFDTDGRRYIIACRNPAPVRRLRSLSMREGQVAYYAALGHSTKVIAYELGLAPSTVSTVLRRALVKLGISNRTRLAGLGSLLRTAQRSESTP